MNTLKTSDLLELAGIAVGLTALCLVIGFASDASGASSFGISETVTHLLGR